MVQLSTIQQANSRFASNVRQGYVSVFAGATSGIGLATLRRLATMLPPASTFYILGRSEAKFSAELKELRSLNRESKFTFIEMQFSSIAEVNEAGERIKEEQERVDLLCVSAGGIPYEGATYTKEGLEANLAIGYYSRIALTINLLPLLRESSSARVLSILGATREKPIVEEDISLVQNWSILNLMNHAILCTNFALEHLAAEPQNKAVTFVHSFPWLVHTKAGRPLRLPPASARAGFFKRALFACLQLLSRFLCRWIGFTMAESGERHTYDLTTDTIGPGGFWRLDKMDDVAEDNEVLKNYRERGWTEKIWDHTMGVYDKVLQQ